MRQQEGIQATQLRNTGWQCLQAVEAQVQVGQVGEATQAGRQRGEGAPEAGTQSVPMLPTWVGERQTWLSEPESQVPAQPCQPGK